VQRLNVTITSTDTRPADGSAIARPRVDAMARCGKGVNPFPPRRMAASALGRDAEPSAGRVVVEVIVTLNHFTELAIGTTATGGKRGFDVRSRVVIDFMMKADAVAPCASRHST
jgi:hypothetical protein